MILNYLHNAIVDTSGFQILHYNNMIPTYYLAMKIV